METNKQIQQNFRIVNQFKKLVILLHSNNEKTQKEIKKATPFRITSKIINLRVQSTQEVKTDENDKTLLKIRFKEDTTKWKDIRCSCIGSLNVKI